MSRLGPLAPLGHANFALLCSGQFAANLGTQVLTAVLAWHIYQLTDSAFALGLAGLFRALPLMAFSLVGGLMADKMERRTLLLITQALTLALAGWLATLASLDVAVPTHLYAFALVTAATGALDSPARQAIVPSLVRAHQLGTAVTLFISVRKTASVAGPFAGGMAIAWLGIAGGYWVGVACFMASLAMLAAMRLGSVAARPRPRASLAALAEGVRFVWISPIILALLLTDFVVMLFGGVRGVLPVFARDVLLAGPEGFALLGSAMAAGSLLGLGVSLGLGNFGRRGLVVMLAAAGYGLSIAAFGMAASMPLALLALGVAGALDTVGETARDTLLLTETPDELRGRVNSFANVFTQGGPSLGQLVMGVQVNALGPQAGVAFGSGCILFAVCALLARVPALRRYGAMPSVEANPGNVGPSI